MYYKLEKGSEVAKNMQILWENMKKCNVAASNYLETLGFELHASKLGCVAGGIGAIKSDVKPEGYRRIGRKDQGMIYPRANNKVLIKAFDELPIITDDEFNEVIGFKSQFSDIHHHRRYGLYHRKEGFLVHINDKCQYEPIEGMIEILASEFKKLENEQPEA